MFTVHIGTPSKEKHSDLSFKSENRPALNHLEKHVTIIITEDAPGYANKVFLNLTEAKVIELQKCLNSLEL